MLLDLVVCTNLLLVLRLFLLTNWCINFLSALLPLLPLLALGLSNGPISIHGLAIFQLSTHGARAPPFF